MLSKDYISKAIKIAAKAHDKQYRKCSNLPYITHLMECGFILSGITTNNDIIIAGILHDTIEDTYIDYEFIMNNFNENVANMVKDVSENKRKGLPSEETWKIRKKESIDHYASLEAKSQLILLADKLSNLRAMKDDYSTLGESLWERFNEKNKDKHAWYYGEIIRILEPFDYLEEYKELKSLYGDVFKQEEG